MQITTIAGARLKQYIQAQNSINLQFKQGKKAISASAVCDALLKYEPS